MLEVISCQRTSCLSQPGRALPDPVLLETREGGDLVEAPDHVLAAVQLLPHGGQQRGVTAQGDVVTDAL